MGKVQEHKRAAKAKRQEDFTSEKSNREDRIEIGGVVTQCLPNTMFWVEITESAAPELVGRTLLGTLVGKMRLFRIRVLPGDQVKGFVSKYDIEKCKITYRAGKTGSQ